MRTCGKCFRRRAATRPTVVLVAVFGCLLFFAALLIVWWLAYVGQGKRGVEAKQAELREAGYILTLGEVNRRYHDLSLDPAENAAPLYVEAMSRLRGVPRDADVTLGEVRNAILELEPGEDLQEEFVKSLAEVLETNAKVLEVFRAAAGRPYARFDLDFGLGHDLFIPHVGAMRQGARLLALGAMRQTLNGETGAAVDSLGAALAMAGHLADEPTLISQLTRIAVIGIVLETMEWLLIREPLSLASLETLESSLRWHEANAGMRLAMESEMAFGNFIFSGSPAVSDFADNDMWEEKWPAVFHVLSGRIHRDHLFYLTTFEDRLKAMREPVGSWVSYDDAKWEDEAEREGHLLTAMILPSIGRVLQAEVNTVTRLRIARILLAMERYRAEEGDLPGNLEGLVPRFLEALPADPFSGSSFILKREDGWVKIESAGEMPQGPDRELRPIQGRLPLSREGAPKVPGTAH